MGGSILPVGVGECVVMDCGMGEWWCEDIEEEDDEDLDILVFPCLCCCFMTRFDFFDLLFVLVLDGSFS